MRIVFVLCEGAHDVAFLSRILCSDSYVHYNKKISGFPFPLGKWLVKSTQNLSVEDLNVDKVYKELGTVLPGGALKHDGRDQLILLYSLNGDSRQRERQHLIRTINNWITTPADEKEFSISEESSLAGNNYGLVIFYDADDKGIDARIEEVRNELGEVFPFASSLSKNGDVACENDRFKVGAYIFADQNNDLGTLENILLPLMKDTNEEIFDDAEKFLVKHKDDNRLKPLVFDKDDKGNLCEIRRTRANKYYPIKSLIGVVGQLQNSGTSNTVCIEKADYITLDKIQANKACSDILEMFKNL